MAVAVNKRGGRRKESLNRPKQPPQQQRWFTRSVWWGGGLSLLLVLAGAVYLWQQGGRTVPDVELEAEPVTAKQALLSGEITHIEPQQISRLVNEHGKVGFLALDPEQLRAAIEALPWVYRARVRKVWPDRLDLWVEEQRPAVIWGEQGYLNLDGLYFDRDGVDLPKAELPQILSAQEDTVAVYQQLQRLNEILQRQSQTAAVERMEVDRRGAVSLSLRNRLVIHLGRREVEKRLSRWVLQSEVVMSRFEGQVDGVDLRYERGMVLQLKQEAAGGD
jgi:cell division protein FtsQ